MVGRRQGGGGGMITQVSLHFSFHEIFWVHSSGGKDGLTSDQGVEDIIRGPPIGGFLF